MNDEEQDDYVDKSWTQPKKKYDSSKNREMLKTRKQSKKIYTRRFGQSNHKHTWNYTKNGETRFCIDSRCLKVERLSKGKWIGVPKHKEIKQLKNE